MTSLAGTLAMPLAVLILAMTLGSAAGGRKDPPPPLAPVVQALKPSGLRISVLDEEGMDLVIMRANINEPLESKEDGQIKETVFSAQNGFWTVEVPAKQLKLEDTVFYSILYSIEERVRKTFGSHVVSELVDRSCRPSITTVNGKQACKGALVFEDNFNTLNKTAWKHNIQFYGEGYNFEFNTYVPDEENSFVKDGSVCLKPTVVADEDELMTSRKLEGCTAIHKGEYCAREPFSWNILPPAHTAWLTSAMGFRFGRVEIRAKAAVGDWLDSRAFLEPRDHEYGKGVYQSGRVEFLRVRGNPDLRDKDNVSYGANLFRGNIGLESCSLSFFYYWEKYLSTGLYSDTFHTYAVTWTPRSTKYEIDGEVVKTIAPPLPNGILGIDTYSNCTNSPWEKGSFMAPLDKEFNINLAVTVGGYYIFTDGSKSGKHVKPYRDLNPQGPLEFWRARDSWLPTWKEDFQIDYVKVWAL